MAVPLISEIQLRRAARPFTELWRDRSIAARGTTRLGVSFRPPQVDAVGLDPRAALNVLLARPFQIIRLGAYWNRIEREPGAFDTTELDSQVDAAEAAGKEVILCAGALKTFGYPEFFVPAHQLATPLREGALVEPAAQAQLLDAATAFVTRIVERYKTRKAIVAWQVEHEAVDPLGMEHSWRLAAAFVRHEVEAVRKADPSRPVMMNGFLPTSSPVRLQQWWRTRDQGDSLAIAQELADIVGIDYYPRHALFAIGNMTLYLDGGTGSMSGRRRRELFAWARAKGRKLMISEGQAEPWEAITVPPNPSARSMYSCTPELVIDNYNRCMGWARTEELPLDAYIFWGAEYWVLRQRSGDPRYLQAVDRILEER